MIPKEQLGVALIPLSSRGEKKSNHSFKGTQIQRITSKICKPIAVFLIDDCPLELSEKKIQDVKACIQCGRVSNVNYMIVAWSFHVMETGNSSKVDISKKQRLRCVLEK